MKKTFYIIGTIVVALAVSGYFLFGKRGAEKYDFRFDKVSQGDLTVYVTATGTVNAVTSVEVGTQVSGIITKLYADFNSVVKEGQVIAQLDTTFLYQSLKDAEASLERAQAQFDESKRNLDREKVLVQRGLDSQLNYDAALTTYQTNEAAVKSAQASLDRAKINLAYATIYAPINGVVVNRAVNVGQTVAASFSSPTLFTIANDLRRMQVETTVDESDIGRVSIGQEASFTVDAYADEKFSGTVSQIRLAPQSIQNVVNYIVIIDVENDQLKLMPGMTANVKILVASAPNVMKVSNMALRFQPPSDIIDTAGMGSFRGGFMGRGNGGGDSSTTGRSSFAGRGAMGADQGSRGQYDALSGQGMQAGGGQRPGGMGERFQAIRDSILAAHGGKLTQDELRSEMRKMFASRTSAANVPVRQSRPQPKPSKEVGKFGIVSNYPVYEKSAYNAADQSGRGRIWILKSNGLLEPIFVRTGLNDGRFTEISSPRLKPGDRVVLGATSSGDSGQNQTSNPLAGGGRMGGGFR
jgi:HlyD family secretion protein